MTSREPKLLFGAPTYMPSRGSTAKVWHKACLGASTGTEAFHVGEKGETRLMSRMPVSTKSQQHRNFKLRLFPSPPFFIHCLTYANRRSKVTSSIKLTAGLKCLYLVPGVKLKKRIYGTLMAVYSGTNMGASNTKGTCGSTLKATGRLWLNRKA